MIIYYDLHSDQDEKYELFNLVNVPQWIQNLFTVEIKKVFINVNWKSIIYFENIT